MPSPSLHREKERTARSSSSGLNRKTATADNVEERHAQFVAAMDSLPENVWGSAKTVDRLAAILHWKREEIELHAYMYMTALVEAEEKEYSEWKKNEEQQPKRRKLNSWTPDEIRLLQTLLATFAGTPGGGVQNSTTARITRFFPQQTESQVQRQVSLLLNASG